MAIERATPQSRRAILAAALGAGAATVASAIARADLARAADFDPVLVGATVVGTMPTVINNTTNDNIVFEASSTGAGAGVQGGSSSGIGVLGNSNSGDGVSGGSTSSAGVSGSSASGPGLKGGTGTSTGAYGYSGPNGLPAVPANTGVFGAADLDSTAHGVHGKSPAGQGVRGEATTTGIGGYFTAPSTGIALQASGKVKFSRSGKASMAAGTSSKTVSLAGVTTASMVFAVLASNRSGRYVRAVVPGSGSFTIYLNTTVLSSTSVSWFVLN